MKADRKQRTGNRFDNYETASGTGVADQTKKELKDETSEMKWNERERMLQLKRQTEANSERKQNDRFDTRDETNKEWNLANSDEIQNEMIWLKGRWNGGMNRRRDIQKKGAQSECLIDFALNVRFEHEATAFAWVFARNECKLKSDETKLKKKMEIENQTKCKNKRRLIKWAKEKRNRRANHRFITILVK